MLVLVWREAPIRAEVVRTFHKLYLLNQDVEDAAGGAAFGALGGEDAENEVAPTAPSQPDDDATAAAPPPTAADSAPAPVIATSKPKRVTAARRGGKKSASEKAADDEDDEDDNDDAAPPSIDDSDDSDDAGGGRARKPRTGAAASRARKTVAAPKARAAAAPIATSGCVDAAVAASNLVALITGASRAVRASLEEVLQECASAALLPAAVVDELVRALLAARAPRAMHQLTPSPPPPFFVVGICRRRSRRVWSRTH